jgi:anionic cell wall polymer biosynthesis LytR-Cps2A-Psr (LCP) family protein
MKIFKRILLLSFAFFALLAGGFYAVAYFLKSGFEPETEQYADMAPTPMELEAQKEIAAKATTAKPPQAATDQVITASDKQPLSVTTTTNAEYELANGAAPVVRHSGKRINIALIGVDARLNERVKHADANHIISIIPDSGIVEITSIPRDTKADAGFPVDSKLNILTLVRAKRGLNAYLKEAAKIAELDKIDYYVEVGFSQAMGILEMLGYDDPSSKLQVLRSRTALGNGDFQRSYSQGQFVRQMLLKNFNRMTGLSGGLLVRGGLMMVETNITADVAGDIIDALEEKNFGSDPNAVTVRLVPAFPAKLKVYDFTKQETFKQLQGKIERYNKTRDPIATDYTHPIGKYDPLPAINSALSYAKRNVEKNPKHVISRLKTLFDQRAWLQVPDGVERQTIRQQFLDILPKAYENIKKAEDAERVRAVINAEIQIFQKTQM